MTNCRQIYNNGANARTTKNCASCRALNLKLQQIDFAIVDTVLYLDAYPECSKALSHYHKLLQQKEEIKRAISEKCGPITIYGNSSTEAWEWVEGPWPWHADAN